MKYRAVRPAGNTYWRIQWRSLWFFRGYLREHYCGWWPAQTFDTKADAERVIERMIEKDADKGERGPWRP